MKKISRRTKPTLFITIAPCYNPFSPVAKGEFFLATYCYVQGDDDAN
jgi:hypothetical protein